MNKAETRWEKYCLVVTLRALWSDQCSLLVICFYDSLFLNIPNNILYYPLPLRGFSEIMKQAAQKKRKTFQIQILYNMEKNPSWQETDQQTTVMYLQVRPKSYTRAYQKNKQAVRAGHRVILEHSVNAIASTCTFSISFIQISLVSC